MKHPAATAVPITPATFGPIACMSRKFEGLYSLPTLFDTLAAIGTAELASCEQDKDISQQFPCGEYKLCHNISWESIPCSSSDFCHRLWRRYRLSGAAEELCHEYGILQPYLLCEHTGRADHWNQVNTRADDICYP